MAVLVALVLVAGPHPAAAAIVALAYLSPPGFLLAAAGWSALHAVGRTRANRALPGAEAAFLRGMAGEIEAGASLRQALAAAADRAPDLSLATAVRLARAGRPAAEIADQLEQVLKHNGRLAGAAYRLVSEEGARAGPVFAGLAVRAADAGELQRTRRVVTAQARLSAWVVGGLPIGATGALMIMGRGPDLAGPAGVVSAIGAALVGLGAIVIWLMVRDR